MTFDVEFYIKSNGIIPVQDFLYSLEPKLRAKALICGLCFQMMQPEYSILHIIIINAYCCMDLSKKL